MKKKFTGTQKRRITNFLLQPLVQLRIGFYQVALSIIFVLSLAYYLYIKLVDFAEVIATLTEADEQVYQMLTEYLITVGKAGLSFGVLYILVTFAITIYTTHRLVGPTVAFRRQIRSLINGQYGKKISLRLGDAFTEVADDLNELSDSLKTKHH